MCTFGFLGLSLIRTYGGARADLKVEVKARKWLVDVAIVCPATKSVVARQNTHLHPGVSAR